MGHVVIALIWGVLIIAMCAQQSLFLALACAIAYLAEMFRSSAHLRSDDA